MPSARWTRPSKPQGTVRFSQNHSSNSISDCLSVFSYPFFRHYIHFFQHKMYFACSNNPRRPCNQCNVCVLFCKLTYLRISVFLPYILLHDNSNGKIAYSLKDTIVYSYIYKSTNPGSKSVIKAVDLWIIGRNRTMQKSVNKTLLCMISAFLFTDFYTALFLYNRLSTSSTASATKVGTIMNEKLRYDLSSHLDDLKIQFATQKDRLSQLDEYAGMRLKARVHGDRSYYSVFDEKLNSYRYIGKENNEIISLIKEAHFLKMSVSELSREIKLLEKVLCKSRNVDYETINKSLNKVYRSASLPFPLPSSERSMKWKQAMEDYKKSFSIFMPDELIHKTQDGQYVRSKGEALIYNYLLFSGVTFIYELPLKVKNGFKDSLLLPDFTILSEIDYESVVYIEHQGMMSSSNYRNKFNETVYKYWSNNYIPERDVFFTFDLPNGGFDDSPIKGIIQRFIRPAQVTQTTS